MLIYSLIVVERTAKYGYIELTLLLFNRKEIEPLISITLEQKQLEHLFSMIRWRPEKNLEFKEASP